MNLNLRLTPRCFSPTRALLFADSVLSRPPAKQHIERVPGIGDLVARFVLPLELCPTQNITRHGQAWKLGIIKREAYALMLLQIGGRLPKQPLPGRPMVRCVRFSSAEPDKYNDGFKSAIDRLCCGPYRLGYLVDDKPSCADVHQWWEPAPRGRGVGLIEVWAGGKAA